MQGLKSEISADTPTFTGYPIAPACESVGVPFTGWTIYGYWLEGQLLRGKPALATWDLPKAKATAEDRKAKRDAWKKAVMNASISRQEATQSLQEHLGYAIPTLDEPIAWRPS